MADEDLPVITESEWNAQFGGGDSSREEDIPVITESEWNKNFASPGIEKLLGEDTENRLVKGARIGVGGLSQFLPFGDEIVAGGSALVDALRGGSLGDSYDSRLKEVRDYQEAFNKKSDELGGIAEPVVKLGGALALPGGLAKNATTATGKLGLMALEGGAVGGLYGADAANGGLEERLQGAKEGATTGAALSAAFGAPLVAAEKVLPSLSKAGQSLQRSSVGAKASDYKRGLTQSGVWDIVDDAVESKTKKALDRILESGELGSSRNGEKMLATALSKQEELSTQIDDVIRKADKGGAFPDFDSALGLLEKGKVPADKIEGYLNDIATLDQAIKSYGKGSLEFLQQQKIAIGKRYNPNDTIGNMFNRALYHDVQRAIEKHAPEVIPLNRELANWKIIDPILKSSAGLDEAGNPVKGLMQGLRTSGGYLSTPTLIGGSLGSVGGPIGFGVGTALGAAATKPGMNKLGEGMKLLSKKGSVFSKIGEEAPSIFGKIASESSDSQSGQVESPLGTSTESLLSQIAPQAAYASKTPGEAKSAAPNKGKQLSQEQSAETSNTPDDEFISKLMDAIKYQESRGRNDAVSPKGARGPYQLMPATAKSYGVSDPHDPIESRRGATQLILDEWEALGDLRLALASYNAGRPAVLRQLKKVGGDSYEDIAHLLPKETREYVPSIEKIFAKLMQS